jgi:hypothetical protein
MQRPRTPSKLSESLHQRLNSYAVAASAAGVGVLALVQPAEGKIVYHHAHHQIRPNRSYKLDLNHDGIADFIFKNLYGSQSGGALSLNVPFVWKNEAVWATAAGYAASALPAGIQVGSKARFGYASSDQMAAEVSHSGHLTSFGPWCGAKNRYLGLKFPIGNGKHFAWARLSVVCRRAGVFATLTGYAYETIPNKPIITGKTHGPDVITLEPASLGHLARGASSIPAWRTKETK